MADRLRAVFFDLDGTLLHDGADEAIRRTAHVLGERYGFAPQRILAANASAWRECWAEHGQRWMRGELGTDETLPRAIWRSTLSVVGDGAERLLDEAVALHVEAEQDTFRVFPETVDVLERVRAGGHAVGVITNGPGRFQRAKLVRARIDHLVDVVVASGDLGVIKPDAAIFRHALEQVRATPAEALHVGDDFTADVVGAHRAGIAAAWINRRAGAAPDDRIPHRDCRSLDDVIDLVGAREPAG